MLGYQEEEGLSVTFQPGGPTIDPLPLVASGQYEIGQQSSSPQIMLAASRGIPVQCFATALQQHPFAYFSLPSLPVRTPQDMVGKKVGVQPAGGAVLLSALLRKNGISEADVEMVNVGSDVNPLLTGQVDAIAAWRTNVGTVGVLGPDAITLPLWDFGVRLLALPYYARTDKLAENPELYASYLRAASRGWQFALEKPEEAMELFVKAYPNLDAKAETTALQLLQPFAVSDLTRTDGWGAFDPAVWQENITTFEELKQFEAATPTLDEVMTTTILDLTKGKRARIG